MNTTRQTDSGIRSRQIRGFSAGALIGALGGLIGLGGAEFRLPVLVGMFRLSTLEAVILNKAMSLVVVFFSLIFRGASVPYQSLADNSGIIINLLAGSLVSAWWAAGKAVLLPAQWLNRIVLTLLLALAAVMLSEAAFGLHSAGEPLFSAPAATMAAGLIAGFVIGTVAALLGVAGGELLIPTIVILFGADIKLAGSLSLAVSLPTMIAGFARYTQADAFAVIKSERPLMAAMAAGSILGAFCGSLMLGQFPTRMLTVLLGMLLLLSAVKTFRHSR